MNANNTSVVPRFQFETRDTDEFMERMSTIAPGIQCSPNQGTDSLMTVNAAKLPGMGLFRAALSNFRVFSSNRSFYSITIPLSGAVDYFGDNGQAIYSEDAVYVSHPEVTFNCRVGKNMFGSLVVIFERNALDAFASRMNGDNRSNHSLPYLEQGEGAGQSFVRQARFLWEEILRGGKITCSGLVQQEFAHLLQALFVEAATPVNDKSKSGNAGVDDFQVKSAEEYLTAHLSEPISLADVAAAAGVSIRTIARGFRHRHGMGVMTFLRCRRLEAVNRSLLLADHESTSVSQVATYYGFSHFGRFSAYYREMFGELPSQTLRG